MWTAPFASFGDNYGTSPFSKVTALLAFARQSALVVSLNVSSPELHAKGKFSKIIIDLKCCSVDYCVTKQWMFLISSREALKTLRFCQISLFWDWGIGLGWLIGDQSLERFCEGNDWRDAKFGRIYRVSLITWSLKRPDAWIAWSLKWKAWSLKIKAWSLKLKAWSLKSKAWSLKIKAWSLKIKAWSLNWKTWSLKWKA